MAAGKRRVRGDVSKRKMHFQPGGAGGSLLPEGPAMVKRTDSRILVVSWNPMLEQTRRLILGTYFETDSAGRMSEVGQRLSDRRFALIVLCDTISDSECIDIEEMAGFYSEDAALILLEPPDRERPAYIKGLRVPCFQGPLFLLKTCAEALGSEVALRYSCDTSLVRG
jgi:hypothetical protein